MRSMTRRRPAAFLLVSLLGALLLWGMAQHAALAQEPDILTAGVAATGEITSAGGDEWVFTACAGSTISVTMQSAQFTPYLELYTSDGVNPLVEAGGVGETAQIDGYVVHESDTYTIIAAGRRRSDRGAYALSLVTTAPGEQEGVDDLIAPGSTMQGTIRARRSAAWGFHGCAGDVVTIQAESDDFDVYVELYRSGDETVLAADDNSGRSSDAAISAFVLPATGNYTIVVLGATRLDAGAYDLTLALESGDGSAAPPNTAGGATPTYTPTPTRTRTPTRTPTHARTATPTPSAATCTVVSSTLNVRSGPDTVYTPPIGSLRQGVVVRMVARNAASTWVQIEETATGLTGWVSAASQYVACNRAVSSLALGFIPPTPTTAATATPTPTPTTAVARVPTPPAEIGIGGGGGAGLNGALVADIAMFTGPSDNPVFTNRLYFRMFVWDPNRGNQDGDGIDHVEFEIFEQFGDFRTVHTQRENNHSYCSFGGGEPNCNVLSLGPGATWPSTGIQIESGDYSVQATVFQDGGNTLNWNTNFTLNLGGNPPSGGGGGAQAPFVLYDGDPQIRLKTEMHPS